jgi:hypothetical protein
MMVRLALGKMRQHPYVIQYQQWALWSINERLAGREGQDLPRPETRYLGDLVTIQRAETAEQARRDRKRSRRR